MLSKTSHWLQNKSSVLAWPKGNFYFEIKGRFWTTWTWCVTLHLVGLLRPSRLPRSSPRGCKRRRRWRRGCESPILNAIRWRRRRCGWRSWSECWRPRSRRWVTMSLNLILCWDIQKVLLFRFPWFFDFKVSSLFSVYTFTLFSLMWKVQDHFREVDYREFRQAQCVKVTRVHNTCLYLSWFYIIIRFILFFIDLKYFLISNTVNGNRQSGSCPRCRRHAGTFSSSCGAHRSARGNFARQGCQKHESVKIILIFLHWWFLTHLRQLATLASGKRCPKGGTQPFYGRED